MFSDADAHLLSRIEHNDPTADAECVKLYYSYLVNFVRRQGIDNDAEDIVQETFLSVFKY